MPEIRNQSFLLKAIYDRLAGVGIADASSGLDAEVGADGLHVDVQAQGDTISQTPTITAGAYVAGDNVGGLLTFANAARAAGKGGILNTLLVVDDAKQDAELELWLFSETFTAGADNAAWDPSDADLENLIQVLTTADGAYFDATDNSAAMVEYARRYDLLGTSLFGRLVTRGTPTYANTTDLTVKVGLVQD